MHECPQKGISAELLLTQALGASGKIYREQHCMTPQRLITVDFLLEENREDCKVRIRMKFKIQKEKQSLIFHHYTFNEDISK